MKKKILIVIPIILIIGVLFYFVGVNRNDVIPEFDEQTFNECKELILQKNIDIDKYFSQELEANSVKFVGAYNGEEIEVFTRDKFLDILTKRIGNYTLSALKVELQNRGYKLLDNYVVNNKNFEDYKFIVSEHNEFEMVNKTILKEKYDVEKLFFDESIKEENRVYILVKGFINENGEISLLYEIEKKLIGEKKDYLINNVFVIGNDVRNSFIDTMTIKPGQVDNYDNSHVIIEE